MVKTDERSYRGAAKKFYKVLYVEKRRRVNKFTFNLNIHPSYDKSIPVHLCLAVAVRSMVLYALKLSLFIFI